MDRIAWANLAVSAWVLRHGARALGGRRHRALKLKRGIKL